MGTVTQLPSLQSLKKEVSNLTALVAGLMAVLQDREILKDDELTEIVIAANYAQGQGPDFGHPPVIANANRAAIFAEYYESSGAKDAVLAELEEVKARFGAADAAEA